jgi:predicted DsbA family dithiol-disulfide isomerase
MIKFKESLKLGNPYTALHWYDFVCPFCYVSQNRNAILEAYGLHVVELPFQVHPEIPLEGLVVGPREGEMYERLEREARSAGLPLTWPAKLPNTRMALATAEWVRLHRPQVSARLNKDLFAAHFAWGEDLGDPAVVDRYAEQYGVDLDALHLARADGSAMQTLGCSQTMAHDLGVRGTPAWLVSQRLVSGLRPVEEFRRLAEQAVSAPGRDA